MLLRKSQLFHGLSPKVLNSFQIQRRLIYNRQRHEYDEDSYGEDGGYRRTFREWFVDNRPVLKRVTLVAGGAGAYYWYNLESTPITGRRRFMSVSPEQEVVMAESSLKQIMEQYHGAMLPAYHPIVKYVDRVAKRIIEAVDPKLIPEGTKWRVHVIQSPTANAFVLPGGDIFVFTGILPIAKTESGLAAILGHEVAHQLARHGAEKISFYHFFTLAATLVKLFVTGDMHLPFEGVVRDFFLFLPFSRMCEVEADYIGLLVMARACYDPVEAIGVWRRMSSEGGGKEAPAFMSTHPSHSHRIEKIESWLPEAQKEYEQSGCHQQLKDTFFSSVVL